MSPADARYWLLAQQRVARLRPDVATALLRAFVIVRENLTDAELSRVIASGDLDRIFRDLLTDATIDRAFIPYRAKVRSVVERGFKYATADLPKGGKVDGVLSVAFDHLNPRVIDAIRRLETPALNTLKGQIKEVVRAFAENGLRDGKAPTVIARGLRDVIGLAPNQLEYVTNLRAELESGRYADAARRQLLDRRFNLAKLDSLSPAARATRIDRIVETYRTSYIAFNADVNAKTAVFDSYKLGQRLSWEDAIDQGIVDRDLMVKVWIHLDEQPHPRPEHAALQGEMVGFDALFSNGQMIPGLGDVGCHCQARYSQRAQRRAA